MPPIVLTDLLLTNTLKLCGRFDELGRKASLTQDDPNSSHGRSAGLGGVTGETDVMRTPGTGCGAGSIGDIPGLAGRDPGFAGTEHRLPADIAFTAICQTSF